MPGATIRYSNFAAAWSRAEQVPGWLTAAQGRALWDTARRVGAGATIVEIGSHQGRSTIVLAAAAQAVGAAVVAIDPFVEGAMFGGAATRERFEQNLTDAGLRDVVRLVSEPSTDVRPDWTEPLSVVYVDGKHDYWTLSDDLLWAQYLPPRGRLLVHDAFSSVGVTLGILRHVLPGRRLRYVDRHGSLATFEIAAPSRTDRLRIVQQLPWWLRNVAVKIVLRVGRLFGHRDTPDPY